MKSSPYKEFNDELWAVGVLTLISLVLQFLFLRSFLEKVDLEKNNRRQQKAYKSTQHHMLHVVNSVPL